MRLLQQIVVSLTTVNVYEEEVNGIRVYRYHLITTRPVKGTSNVIHSIAFPSFHDALEKGIERAFKWMKKFPADFHG